MQPYGRILKKDVAQSMRNRLLDLALLKKDLRVTRGVVRRVNSRSNAGRKLFAAGLILTFGTPDPFTDIIGWPLLVAGVVVKRTYSHIGVKDALEEYGGICQQLSDLSTI